MKQISDGETTTSSRPAFRGLTAASVMMFRLSLVADGNDSFYHTPPVTSRQPSPTLPFVREPAPDVVDFYDRHPINETQVLASARDGTAGLRALGPEDLWRWDQDHYGGPAPLAAPAQPGSPSATGSRARGSRTTSAGDSPSGWPRWPCRASTATGPGWPAPASTGSWPRISPGSGSPSCRSACGCTAACGSRRWPGSARRATTSTTSSTASSWGSWRRASSAAPASAQQPGDRLPEVLRLLEPHVGGHA